MREASPSSAWRQARIAVLVRIASMNGIQPCWSVSRVRATARMASAAAGSSDRIVASAASASRVRWCSISTRAGSYPYTLTTRRRPGSAPGRTRCRWRIARGASPSTAGRRRRGTSASGRRPTRARRRRPAGFATCRPLRTVRVPSPGSPRARLRACGAVVARVRNVDACWLVVILPHHLPITSPRHPRPSPCGRHWRADRKPVRVSGVRTMS